MYRARSVIFMIDGGWVGQGGGDGGGNRNVIYAYSNWNYGSKVFSLSGSCPVQRDLQSTCNRDLQS